MIPHEPEVDASVPSMLVALLLFMLLGPIILFAAGVAFGVWIS